MRVRDLLVVAAGAAICTVVIAAPALAAASVSPPCSGTVTIPTADGGAVEWSSESGEDLVIPADAGTVSWTGSTGDTVITDHSGEVGVVVGPATIPLGDWSGENAAGETAASGEYDLADLRADLPFELVGVFEVSGTHSGEGGSCDGLVTVVVEGSPLTTVLGATGLAATVIGLGGLVAAAAGGSSAAAASAGTAGGAAGPGAAGGGPTPGDGAGGA